jgi:hypothetical protein
MHLERPFLPLLPPRQHPADISAARNLNSLNRLHLCISYCTYTIVRNMFLQEHYVKSAVMFLQEHPPANSATPRPGTPGLPDSREPALSEVEGAAVPTCPHASALMTSL